MQMDVDADESCPSTVHDEARSFLYNFCYVHSYSRQSHSLGPLIFVNNLLQTARNPEWEPEPFEFLIDGELVRMSLEQFLLAKGMSAEKTVEIEYIRALVPRKQAEPSLHDVRVSSVDGSYSGVMLKVMCLSRREKGMINLSNLNGREKAASTLVGHTQCISSVKWPQQEYIYSASWNHSIRRWV